MTLLPMLPTSAAARLDDLLGASNRPEPAPIRQIDDAALAAITDLYREILPAGGAILDLMSGWVSHLPPEIPYSRVVGLGLNACELAENPFLDEWRVQDLNRSPRLPFAAAEFDGAALCVSVQHLTRPAEVIREVGRVLKPGAPLGRDLLGALPPGPRHRLLVSARRHRAFVPDRASFWRSRQLGRHPVYGSHPARRRRPALRSDRAQPWSVASRQRRLSAAAAARLDTLTDQQS